MMTVSRPVRSPTQAEDGVLFGIHESSFEDWVDRFLSLRDCQRISFDNSIRSDRVYFAYHLWGEGEGFSL